jgi:hypothetical protein
MRRPVGYFKIIHVNEVAAWSAPSGWLPYTYMSRSLIEALSCSSRVEERDQRFIEGLPFYPEKGEAPAPAPSSQPTGAEHGVPAADSRAPSS